MKHKSEKQCYVDLLSQLDKLDMQVEGIKDQLKNLKQLIVGSTPTESGDEAPSMLPAKEKTSQ